MESRSSNCYFRDAVSAAVIGIFHGIRSFEHSSFNRESLAGFCLSSRHIRFELN